LVDWMAGKTVPTKVELTADQMALKMVELKVLQLVEH
jgi:hypothetical protein